MIFSHATKHSMLKPHHLPTLNFRLNVRVTHILDDDGCWIYCLMVHFVLPVAAPEKLITDFCLILHKGQCTLNNSDSESFSIFLMKTKINNSIARVLIDGMGRHCLAYSAVPTTFCTIISSLKLKAIH